MKAKLLNFRGVIPLPLRSSLRWALLITLVLSLIQPTPAYAASLVVNTLEDELNSDGDCSLREAIQAANDNTAVDACPAGETGNPDEISFAVSGTITLSAQLDVTAGGPLVIDGANAIEVSGGGMVRVMFVNSDAVVRLEDLAISNGTGDNASGICSPYIYYSCGGGILNLGTLTLTGSTLSDNGGFFGGGIYNAGTLALDQVVLADNNANNGGGIYNHNGQSTISDSTFSGNNGAGIYNSGTLEVTGGSFSRNHGGFGGAIQNDGTLTIMNSSVSDNDASDGGGIYNSYNTGTLTLINSSVSGNSSEVYGGGILNDGTMHMSNSYVSGNRSSTFAGGISNGGTLHMTSSEVWGNHAYRWAGGIENGGVMVINNSSVFWNTTYYYAGGIFNYGTLTIENNSTISGNDGNYAGGGILNLGPLTITQSTVSNNASQLGGGILNTSTLTLSESTLTSNGALQGGGILNVGTLALSVSTLSGNSAQQDGGALLNANSTWIDDIEFGWGGPGMATVSNSTLSGNFAYGEGGGIFNEAGTVTLYSSILAYTPSGGNCDGAIIDAGYNIEDADACSLIPANGSLPNTDPLLGPLADNGGPTQTHALQPGSPAIDAGDPLNCPVTDQRGVPRPLDGNNDGIAACDIGAYEAGIVATVDITRNIIRLPSNDQWMIGYIELPNGFDVASIDLSTVRLQRTIPAVNQLLKVGDHDKDGNPDIMVQFSQQSLIAQLGGVTGRVELLVTGTLLDGTPFEGRDTIVMSQKR